MDTSKIVGEKIKALREDKSITIEELAQRSGLAIEQIERIENNIDIPSLAPLIKIARIIGEADRIFGFFLTTYHRAYFILIAKESAQTNSQHAGNLNKRRKISQLP